MTEADAIDPAGKYKCHNCFFVLRGSDLVDGACPECGKRAKKMCPNDSIDCPHDVVETIAYCELCGEACCPRCKCHSVFQISRVTGYLQDVGGWNSGKRQELKDRTRFNFEDKV